MPANQPAALTSAQAADGHPQPVPPVPYSAALNARTEPCSLF